jgi:hypothetical protein
VDHIAILAKGSSGWKDVSHLPGKSGSIRMRDLRLQPGAAGLCVEAVGKASMLNHFSGPVELSAR